MIKTTQKNWRVFLLLMFAHAAATVIINVWAALWWVKDYEETFMQGDEVVEPLLLKALQILSKALLYPLAPLLPPSGLNLYAGVLMLALNSLLAATGVWLIWFSVKFRVLRPRQ